MLLPLYSQRGLGFLGFGLPKVRVYGDDGRLICVGIEELARKTNRTSFHANRHAKVY